MTAEMASPALTASSAPVRAVAAPSAPARATAAHRVESALRRHGLEIVAHAAKRHAAQQRAADVVVALGYGTVAAYIRRRRADGWTWKAIAAESGQPQTWLRRQA